MNVNTGLRFLRPYLFAELSSASRSAYIRFYHSTRYLAKPETRPRGVDGINTPDLPRDERSKPAICNTTPAQFAPRYAVQQRLTELKEFEALLYPRIQRLGKVITVAEFLDSYRDMKTGEKRPEELITIQGRVSTIRIAGSKLMFLDIVQDGHTTQGVCNFIHITSACGLTESSPEIFRQFYHILRRGDIISISGNPYVTKSGQLSVNAVALPMLLSPCLASLPTTLEDPQTRIRNRHVDLLVNQKPADTIRVRSHIIQYVRDFLLQDNFLEVQTPIIADNAGGAIARPFTTVATEFSNKELSLRIAPELWLKRMILGGMDRVFEIGPSFRNEGLDATHNPEFTTCEFYKSFATLEDLISMTEQLICGLAVHVSSLRSSILKALPKLDASLSVAPFRRLNFIPTIEAGLGESLPDLAADDAAEHLLKLFSKHNIQVPSAPTLPRLLDALCSSYIETQCNEPTFIMYHPACMAPLAKSFVDPTTKQEVSARVELFIHHKEIANMYEEENSPLEQRKKFIEQARYKDDENKAIIDESYLEALEWGLPPTGGFGCGIDRLCMLYSGSSRISDVLSFGSLKNVVNLGKGLLVEEKQNDVANQDAL